MKLWNRLFIVLKRAGPLLLGLAILTSFFEQLLTQLMEKELSSMSGASPFVWVYGGASIALSIIDPVLVSILIVAALLPGPIVRSIGQHISQVTKEILRAAGKSISWGLLLIIPGLIRFLQFSFVAFVVILDPEYQEGKKDALKESTRLVNKKFFRVTAVLLLFSVVLPVLLTSFDEYTLFDQHPFSALGLAGVDALLSIFCILILLAQYSDTFDKQEEKSDGTHLQLETN